MMHDICNSPASLSEQSQLDDWNGVVHGFLSHGKKTPVHLGALLEANPNFVMGQAARGLFMIMMGRKKLLAVAHEAGKTANQKLREHGGNARERGWVDALNFWLDGKPTVVQPKVSRKNPPAHPTSQPCDKRVITTLVVLQDQNPARQIRPDPQQQVGADQIANQHAQDAV